MIDAKTSIRRHCPYCMGDFDVINVSVRSIEGYRNSLTGKNTAIVEHLSCGHEYVDNKFNIDNIYFRNPVVKEPVREIIRPRYTYRKRNGVNLMDICVLVCLVCLAFMVPPLVILPALYYIGRIKG